MFPVVRGSPGNSEIPRPGTDRSTPLPSHLVAQPTWFSGRRFKGLTTGLIAATTLLGAIGSWRATEANSAARASERKAVVDQRTAVQQETVIRATLLATQYDYMR